MFALVRVELAARVQHVGAALADAVDVVADAREAAAVEVARLVLHELFEAVARQLFVFDVVALVFLYNNNNNNNNSNKSSTHKKNTSVTITFLFVQRESPQPSRERAVADNEKSNSSARERRSACDAVG